MRTTPVRLTPLAPEAWDEDQKAILRPMAAGEGLGRGVLNVLATMIRHPNLCKRWLVFANHVLFKSSLEARARELLILRIAWRCQSRYEWGQHVSIATQAGLSDRDIERVKDGPDASGWSDRERLLLRATDELHDDSTISEETWAGLAACYREQQMMDLVFTVGQYSMLAMALNSFGVELDAPFENDA